MKHELRIILSCFPFYSSFQFFMSISSELKASARSAYRQLFRTSASTFEGKMLSIFTEITDVSLGDEPILRGQHFFMSIDLLYVHEYR